MSPRQAVVFMGIDLDQGEIDYWLGEFEATGNTLAAWKAFRICREIGRDIPEPVMAEFDRIAAELFLDAGPVETRAARILTRKVGKGQADAWSEMRRMERDAQFVSDFYRLTDENGLSETRAFETISKNHRAENISPAGVRKAVKRALGPKSGI